MLLEIFGQDAKSQAERDLGDYNPQTQTIERGAGERFWDNLFGRTQSIQEAGQAAYVEQLGKSQAAKQFRALGGDRSAIDAGTDEVDLIRKTGELQTGKELRSRIKATGLNVGENARDLSGMSNDELETLATSLEDQKSDKDNMKPGAPGAIATESNKRWDRTQEIEAIRRKDEDAYRRWKTKEDDRYRRWQAARDDERYAFEREERNSTNRMNMQLALMDREDKVADRQWMREREDRKDRRASIQNLVEGLTMLGGGMAVGGNGFLM